MVMVDGNYDSFFWTVMVDGVCVCMCVCIRVCVCACSGCVRYEMNLWS